MKSNYPSYIPIFEANSPPRPSQWPESSASPISASPSGLNGRGWLTNETQPHNHWIHCPVLSRQLKHNKRITRFSKKRIVYIPLDEASYLFQTWPSCTLTNHKLVWLLRSITVNNVCAHREWKETTCGTMWPRDHIILTNQIVELYIQLLCSNSYYRISLIRRHGYYFFRCSFQCGYYSSAAFISL